MISEWTAAMGGCVGLCAGDGCSDCTVLADQITRAKRYPQSPYRDARLLLLADRVADVMGAGRG